MVETLGIEKKKRNWFFKTKPLNSYFFPVVIAFTSNHQVPLLYLYSHDKAWLHQCGPPGSLPTKTLADRGHSHCMACSPFRCTSCCR